MKYGILFALCLGSAMAAPIEIETTPEEQAALENEAYNNAAVVITGENWADLQMLYHYHQSKAPFAGGDIVVKCELGVGGKCTPSKAFSSFNNPDFEKDVVQRVGTWDYTSARALDAKILFVPLHFTDFVETK